MQPHHKHAPTDPQMHTGVIYIHHKYNRVHKHSCMHFRPLCKTALLITLSWISVFVSVAVFVFTFVSVCSFLVQSFSSFFQLSQPIPLHHFALHPLHPPLTHIFNNQLHIHKLIFYPPSFSLYLPFDCIFLFPYIHPHYLLSLIKLLFIVSN